MVVPWKAVIYLKHMKGIDIDIQSIPKHATLMNWMAP